MRILPPLIQKKTKKNYAKEKKIQIKACTKPLLCDANYDRKNNDSTNAFCPPRFK